MVNLRILIPSYNEGKTIGGIVKALRSRNIVTYVIDDGSFDNTASVAEAEGAVVIKNVNNRGKGAALREGFKHILKEDFDAVLLMDGDGQHKVEDIDNFLKKMDNTGADILIGNRMLNASSMPYVRMQTNRFMSNLISRISGQHVPDSQCGFRLIKKEVLQKIRLESSNYDIESELIIKAARAGFKIESVPIETVYRGEKSKINPILDTLRFMRLLFKIGLKP